MNDIERHEFRYFFISSLEEEVQARIKMIKGLLLVEYPNPVTETVYFTHGRKASYTVPANQLVRIRKYVGELSETIELGYKDVFLEVKTNCTNSLNHKDRIILSGITALSILAKDIHDQSANNILQSIAHLPPLFPTVATQTKRQHWIHKNGIRITLDKKIRVFAFLDESLKGCHIGSLSEGKIEFKFPKSTQPDTSLTQIVTDNELCVQKDPVYLERRLKECFFQNMIKNSKL